MRMSPKNSADTGSRNDLHKWCGPSICSPTPSSDGDCPIFPKLLDQIPESEEIGTVTADGVYDTRRCHTAIIDRKATPIIPFRKNKRPWREDCPAACTRNETLRASRR